MSKQSISIWPRVFGGGPGAQSGIGLLDRAIAVIFSALVLVAPVHALCVLAAYQPAVLLG